MTFLSSIKRKGWKIKSSRQHVDEEDFGPQSWLTG